MSCMGYSGQTVYSTMQVLAFAKKSRESREDSTCNTHDKIQCLVEPQGCEGGDIQYQAVITPHPLSQRDSNIELWGDFTTL